MRHWITVSALALGSIALGGCGDKSAVELTVTLVGANVSAQNGPLGSTLGGMFQLDFSLGPEASGSTTVSLESFALQSTDGSAIVDPIELDTAMVVPFTVDPGKNVSFPLDISSKALLTQAQHDALCAGQVVIVGSVMDSLKGGTDTVKSVPVSPSCG